MSAHSKLVDEALARGCPCGCTCGHSIIRTLGEQIDHAARLDERERACKAVCPFCAKGVPVVKDPSCNHWTHSDAWDSCSASAIRALSSPTDGKEER